MQKHLLYINLFAITSALALSACADEVENAVTPDMPEVGEKTPIELSVGSADAPSTRAVVIDGKGKVTAFENDTRLHLLMVSVNADDENDKKYTVTYGRAVGSGTPPINVETPPTYSAISFDETITAIKQTHKDGDVVKEGYRNPANESVSKNPVESNSKDGIVRYWDDAHARKSKLSIYGFCINGTVLPFGAPWNQKIDEIASNTQNISSDGKPWKTEGPSTYKIGSEASGGTKQKWYIGDHSASPAYSNQTFLSVLYKDDICYSNNISGTNVLKFSNKELGKFDSGVIEFHRAVSLITVKIIPGAGFTTDLNSNFKFASGKNIEMQGFNKEGYLDISAGTWSDIAPGNWTSICNATAMNSSQQYTETFYTLLAFVIPGNDLNGDSDAANKTAMVFTIDGNEYKLSKQDLLKALKDNTANCESNGTIKSDYMTDGTKLKAGINYEFTFTVGKTAIDKIQASVVDWKTVSATAAPDNAHPLTIAMETLAGGTETPVASYLYKSAVSSQTVEGNGKGYSNEDRFGLAASKEIQNTGWYWPSNSTYYHFRTVSPQEDLTNVGTTSDNYLTMVGDYWSSPSGSVVSAKDYVWGAPLKETHQETPHAIAYNTTTGYTDYLYPAIGPTKDNIHITQLHMMTDLEVKLQTTNTADAVILTDATVELVNYANQANLNIGTGLVNGWADIKTTAQAMSVKTDGSDYTWRTVPQPLSRGDNATDKVGMIITLTDGNIYEIKDLSVLAVKVDDSSTTIPFWEPGKKYVYTLTLKKSAIDNIKATVVDWETVEATYDNVVIQ